MHGYFIKKFSVEQFEIVFKLKLFTAQTFIKTFNLFIFIQPKELARINIVINQFVKRAVVRFNFL